MNNDFQINGVNACVSNFVLNIFFTSQCKSERESEELKAMLEIYNKYGVPSHKVMAMLQELQIAANTIKEKYEE